LASASARLSIGDMNGDRKDIAAAIVSTGSIHLKMHRGV
jgi:hypothetical protein